MGIMTEVAHWGVAGSGLGGVVGLLIDSCINVAYDYGRNARTIYCESIKSDFLTTVSRRRASCTAQCQ